MTSFQVGLEITGARELQAKFTRVGRSLSDGIASEAVEGALSPLVADMQSRAPVRRGELRSSISMAVRRYRQSGVVFGIVGPSWPRGAHGSIIESGTVPRRTGLSAFRGSGPAMPFVEPTYEANRDRIQEDLGRLIGSAIEREASR